MPRKFIVLILLIYSFSFLAFFFSGLASASDTTVFFSPRDECGKVILEKINGAVKSIDVAMYTFTSRALAQALISAVERGVGVRVFMDGENALKYYSKASFLKKSGILVKLERGRA